MNAKIRVTLHYFLSMLEKRLSKEKQESINPFFLQLFTRQELLDILSWLYHGNIPQSYAISEMSSEEMLDAIASERSILIYIVQLWDNEKEKDYVVDSSNVHSTLAQLGLQTHYLADKPLADWDEYDRSNFKSLLNKAGKLTPRYGIFDANVKEEDKYSCNTPAKRYITEWEAQMMLALLIAEGGFCEGELKVMEL
jgi:hypothetical protein